MRPSALVTGALGADFAYIGSAFIATQEANAVESYKQAIVDSAAACRCDIASAIAAKVAAEKAKVPTLPWLSQVVVTRNGKSLSIVGEAVASGSGMRISTS